MIEIWHKSCIIPLSMKNNCCGISLTSVAAKVYNKLILNHVQPLLDSKLQKNHNGFGEKRSTVTQILTIRQSEGAKQKQLPAVLLLTLLTVNK